ncbi:Uncharacterised protein [uncultured archaeon]|nr:Uncharacterised protein [uncultured archaeon]
METQEAGKPKIIDETAFLKACETGNKSVIELYLEQHTQLSDADAILFGKGVDLAKQNVPCSDIINTLWYKSDHYFFLEACKVGNQQVVNNYLQRHVKDKDKYWIQRGIATTNRAEIMYTLLKNGALNLVWM